MKRRLTKGTGRQSEKRKTAETLEPGGVCMRILRCTRGEIGPNLGYRRKSFRAIAGMVTEEVEVDVEDCMSAEMGVEGGTSSSARMFCVRSR